MAELMPNVNYEGAIRQVEDCMRSVFNKGVKYGRYLERLEKLKEKQEEVIHAQWVKKNGYIACSNCGQHGYKPWKRCPMCEAKMDSEET